MKWFNKQKKFRITPACHVGWHSGKAQVAKRQRPRTLLNLVGLLLFGLIVIGCGTPIAKLSPVQPEQNIANALAEKTEKPTAEVVIPAVPSEDILKGLLEKYGMQTVGFRIRKAEEANTKKLTYLFAFDGYAHDIEKWNNFLKDWPETRTQVELASGAGKRRIVDAILVSDDPELFDMYSRQPTLTKTIDGITLSITYWRRADLDFKYNRGNSASPFFESAIMRQGDKTDVFYVKITNNRDDNIIFDVRQCQMIDQTEGIYNGLNFEDLRERFSYTFHITGLHQKNGLEKAREILLEMRMPIIEKRVGNPQTGIEPGESVEGFVPFRQTNLNAVTLNVILPIEKAPPPGGAKRYQTIDFEFPYTHDRGIRSAQPGTKRY